MGKIWEHHECAVLYWNKAQRVIGIKAEQRGGVLHISDIAVSSDDIDSFGIAFSEVTGTILNSETNLILAGGDIPGNVLFDITLPKMSIPDMRQAIMYELPRHIPCDPEDVLFGFRVLPAAEEEEGTSSKNIVRIMIVIKKQWNELMAELSASGVRIDAVVTPYFVVDPLLGDNDDLIFYDAGEYSGFISDADYPGRRIILHDSDEEPPDIPEDDFKKNIEALNYEWDELPQIVKDDPASFFSPLLLAAYGMSKEYTGDKNSMIKLPSSLLPERYRTLRAAFYGLVGTIIFLSLMLVGRYWWEAKDRFDQITREIKFIQNRQISVKAQKTALFENSEIIRELVERQKGIPEIATCLRTLSMTLPKEMWLGSFSARDDTIDVRIIYAKPGLAVPDLNKTVIMKMVTSSTRKNTRDNTTNVFARLTYVPPEKRNGKK